MPPLVDRLGKTYGSLKVISRSTRSAKRAIWVCKCKCGNVSEVAGNDLETGHTKSCGCEKIKGLIKRSTTHGQAPRSGVTTEYTTWNSMLNRCYNKNDKHYADYGKRGITVCRRWRKFENFYADMGKKPKGLTLERVNNSKGYSPSNCIWADAHVQARNTRNSVKVKIKGKLMPLIEACEILDLNYSTILNRRYDGWTMKRAMSTPTLRGFDGL